MDINAATKNLKQIIEQLQVLNSIHTALSMTIKIEDIYSIILSALISHQGLGFTRSFLFLYNPKRDVFEGRYALGPETEEEAKQLIEEQNKEDDYLNDILKNFETEQNAKSEFSKDNIDKLYSNLRSSAVWIASVQNHGFDNALTRKLNEFAFRANPQEDKNENFINVLLNEKQAMRFNLEKDAHLFQKECGEIFDTNIIAVPLKAKKKIKGIIIADKKFSNSELTYLDLKNLDWFASHSSLAIENSELFNDLENMFNELKEVEKLKNNFLSIISHELRTPLTSVLGFVELIINGKVGAITNQQKELLKRVSKNTMHLIHMVNDLIQLGELEAEGIMDVKLSPVDPLNTLFSVIPRLEQRKRSRKVDVELVFTEAPPKILTDEKSLEKIYYHLLDNALKFSPENDKVLVIFKKMKNELTITIEDHGIGIPKEKLQKIFESFYQVDSSLSRSYEGLGVGLAISRLLLTSTNGQIEVQSEVGEGSKFSLKYPIAE